MVWLKYDELWHQNYSAVGRGPSEQLPCSSYPDENYPSHSSLSLTQALGNKGIVEADPSMQVLTPAHQSRIDWQTVTLRAPVKNWSIYPGENPWRSQQSSLDYSCVTNCIQQQHLCEPPPLRREEHESPQDARIKSAFSQKWKWPQPPKWSIFTPLTHAVTAWDHFSKSFKTSKLACW